MTKPFFIKLEDAEGFAIFVNVERISNIAEISTGHNAQCMILQDGRAHDVNHSAQEVIDMINQIKGE